MRKHHCAKILTATAYKLTCKRCRRKFESVTRKHFCVFCEAELGKETEIFLKYVMGDEYYERW